MAAADEAHLPEVVWSLLAAMLEFVSLAAAGMLRATAAERRV